MLCNIIATTLIKTPNMTFITAHKRSVFTQATLTYITPQVMKHIPAVFVECVTGIHGLRLLFFCLRVLKAAKISPGFRWRRFPDPTRVLVNGRCAPRVTTVTFGARVDGGSFPDRLAYACNINPRWCSNLGVEVGEKDPNMCVVWDFLHELRRQYDRPGWIGIELAATAKCGTTLTDTISYGIMGLTDNRS